MNSSKKGHLEHVGVIGMHWGIRRFEDKTADNGRVVALKKGESAQNMSANPNLTLQKNKMLYVSANTRDMLAYRGEYADQLRFMRNVNKVFAYKVTAVEDLVSPGKKERIDEFIRLTGKDKTVFDQMGESNFKTGALFTNLSKYLGITSSQKVSEKYRKLVDSKDPKDHEKAFLAFSSYFPVDPVNRKKYFDAIKKKGYNALYDDNDISGGYQSKSSLIILNSGKSVKITGKEMDNQRATDRAYSEFLKEQWNSKG